MRRILLAVMLFTPMLSLSAKPRPPIKKDTNAPNKLPCLAGPTNWGDLYQTGRVITIDNHPQWYARGQILPNGKVFIIWTWRATNRPAPAPVLYTVDPTDGKTLRGVWGYEGEVEMKGDVLTGSTHPDTTYPIKPTERRID